MTANAIEKAMHGKPATNTNHRLWKKLVGPAKTIVAFSFLAFSCTNAGSKNTVQVKSAATKSGLPVVELFTSEGCSSCPPADRLLSKIKEENSAIVLSYHVDYWDRLGWKDPFSQAAFSNRQRQYAQRFSLQSIYTPQVVVNGQEELVGSDEAKLRAALHKNNNVAAINATATRKNKETVALSYSIPAAASVLLTIALTQPDATTAVKAGENGGRTLHHVNVVQTVKTIDAKADGTAELTLPLPLQQSPLSLVLFTQEKKSLAIRNAIELPVPSYQTAPTNQ